MLKEYTKPKFIKELEAQLKLLEGESFKKESNVFDEDLDLNVNVTRVPSNYCENVLRAVVEIIRPESLKETIVEPNGRNSFPDLKINFTNGFSYDFEVKSWLSYQRQWQAAKVSLFKEALESKDDKYLRTWYVDFSLIENEDSIEIYEINIGRIWDFADGDARSGSGCKNIKGSRGALCPEELIWNGSDHDEELYHNGIDMLESLNINCDRHLYEKLQPKRIITEKSSLFDPYESNSDELVNSIFNL